MPRSTSRGTSTPSTISTSQSPGRDCSTIDGAAPVPSNSLRFGSTSLASSNGFTNASSVWLHRTRALSSPAATAEVGASAAASAVASAADAAAPTDAMRGTTVR